MKTLRNCLLLLLLALFLTGCSGNTPYIENESSQDTILENNNPVADSAEEPSEEETKPTIHVVTTFFVPYEFAREVGGAHADVQMLVTPGENPAEYQMTAEDQAALKACDVFIYSGGIADAWAEEILGLLEEDTRRYSLRDGMEQLIAGGVSPDFLGTGEAGERDIYWIVPVNAMLLCSDISEIFAEIDPEHAKLYDENFAGFVDELSEIDMEITGIMEHVSKDEFLFAGRNSYQGLAEEYQLHYHEADEEAGAAELAEIMKSENMFGFFYDDFSESELVESVSNQAEAEPILLYSGMVISEEGLEGGVTFADLLWKNAESMKNGFR